jgi:hypothetical protein
VTDIQDLCGRRFRLAPALAVPLFYSLCQAERETGLSWTVISGYRTQETQDRLRREGRPAASDACSTHRTLPATGADVRVATFPTRAVKATWGRIAVLHGLRWGGGSPLEDGIPSDWNHVDLGPRCR